MKTGDKVRKKGNNCCSTVAGEIYTIWEKNDSKLVIGDVKDPCSCVNEWELVVNQNNNMNLKEKFVTLFISEPEKSFRKIGITNGDGILTEDGQKVFLGWLLKQNGDAFKKEVVDPMIAEEEKTQAK